jgi:hypothetical protein
VPAGSSSSSSSSSSSRRTLGCMSCAIATSSASSESLIFQPRSAGGHRKEGAEAGRQAGKQAQETVKAGQAGGLCKLWRQGPPSSSTWGPRALPQQPHWRQHACMAMAMVFALTSAAVHAHGQEHHSHVAGVALHGCEKGEKRRSKRCC